MTELIGLEFKRNVYGYSTWTDTVKSVWVRWKIEGDYQVPEIMIMGSNYSYPLSEVCFVRALDVVQRFHAAKEAHHKAIINEIKNRY